MECIEMNLNDPTKKEEENVYVSLFRRLVRPPFFFSVVCSACLACTFIVYWLVGWFSFVPLSYV